MDDMHIVTLNIKEDFEFQKGLIVKLNHRKVSKSEKWVD
jgi:hypothetical protein